METSGKWLPTADDVRFFEERGYWIGPKLFDDEDLNRFREHMDRVYAGEFETGRPPWRGYWRPDDGAVLRKTDNSHWADRTLRDLATDQRIGEIAARLMGQDVVRLWHDQLLYKPGSGPGVTRVNVGWHQDYQYWQCAETPTLLTAWVAFDDVDLDNGCMQFMAGSHRWGLEREGNFFEQDTQEQLRRLEAEHPIETVPVVMRAGQVSFHHCLTFHGSGPNRTRNPRRSLAIHLMAGETRYRPETASDSHMNVELARPRSGEPFSGQWFPVLFEGTAQL